MSTNTTPKSGRHQEPLVFWFLIIFLAIGLSCQPEGPPTAPADSSRFGDDSEPARQPRHDMVESLRADLDAVRHPGDGGGRAFIEEGGAARAGEAGRWVVRYRAGGEGVALGGAVYFQVSPFWGWSTPQALDPARPGFTEVTTEAAGVELRPRTLDQQLMMIEIAGRALGAGEELRIVYGAGPAGAIADRYAESEARLWIAVDADGDGVRRVLYDSPSIAVAAGPPERLVLTLPSTARPGHGVRITAAVLDALGNAGVSWTGVLHFSGTLDGEPLSATELPPPLELGADDQGRRTIDWTPPKSGVVRLAVRGAPKDGSRELVADGNPLQISERGARVLWADLQNHSGLSDGTGTPEDLLVYARDVAALDVVAITDHDHWGMLFLDQHPALWQRLRDATRSFHEPGRFVTLLGYEWTNWIFGHRHVLYFGDLSGGDISGGDIGDAGGLPLRSSIDPAADHPEELWKGLAAIEGRVMTVAHHTAGGPVSTDWSIAPDPRFETLTEIVSVHGSSEAADSPRPIYRPVAGNFVRDTLERGRDDPRYRLGFIGSSDGHDGHPGLAHLASPSGGLAAILAEEATREAVWKALRARHTYATNGPRVLLRATLGGYRMGDEVPLAPHPEEPSRHVFATAGPLTGIPPGTLVVQAITPGEIESVDVVRSGEVESGLCETPRSCSFGLPVEDPRPGEYLYVRVVQKDGGAAWSSPFFFVADA